MLYPLGGQFLGGGTTGASNATLPPDFLAALIAFWSTTAAVTSVSPSLYYGEAPPGAVWPSGAYYPCAVLTQIGGKSNGKNTGKGYWEEKYLQLSIYHPDADTAVILGNDAETTLDPLIESKLRFSKGYQMSFYQTGPPTLMKVAGIGPGGNAKVHQQSYTYVAKIGRNRR